MGSVIFKTEFYKKTQSIVSLQIAQLGSRCSDFLEQQLRTHLNKHVGF